MMQKKGKNINFFFNKLNKFVKNKIYRKYYNLYLFN